MARPAVRRGDVARGFAEAAVSVEATWQTQWIEHAYLEPEAGVGIPAPDGTTVLTVSTQTPYIDRDATAKGLGVRPDEVRVVQAVTKALERINPMRRLRSVRTGPPWPIGMEVKILIAS